MYVKTRVHENYHYFCNIKLTKPLGIYDHFVRKYEQNLFWLAPNIWKFDFIYHFILVSTEYLKSRLQLPFYFGEHRLYLKSRLHLAFYFGEHCIFRRSCPHWPLYFGEHCIYWLWLYDLVALLDLILFTIQNIFILLIYLFNKRSYLYI